MSRLFRGIVPVALGTLLVLGGLWLFGGEGKRELPESLCGTRISPRLLEPLLPAEGDVSERNDVERGEPQPSSPCRVYVGDEVALRLRFAWHSDPVDPLQVAGSVDSVSNLSMPERVDLPEETVIGYDGAISTTLCETEGGSRFTLSVLLEGANSTRDTYRAPLEDFMRAYFPATVKTLNCR
ncbi:hypothetical protein HTV45_28285 [Streptomyces sp. CHD11]|uniref:hypothetical protein n=1 Tax=Streptomyces sp. CHD11 TaxID=2741325 RepID=UPI001BFC80D5|nr:hypothetical protein [Streptomyces sp. CHD11]MBT3154726.1 hypothetical protein [Streptomyces sp. CHD11]